MQDGLPELEGRMLVLEVVAMTSLALALDTSEEGAQMGRNVLQLIRKAVDTKCTEMGLSEDVTATAEEYADELVHTAMASLFPESKH